MFSEAKKCTLQWTVLCQRNISLFFSVEHFFVRFQMKTAIFYLLKQIWCNGKYLPSTINCHFEMVVFGTRSWLLTSTLGGAFFQQPLYWKSTHLQGLTKYVTVIMASLRCRTKICNGKHTQLPYKQYSFWNPAFRDCFQVKMNRIFLFFGKSNFIIEQIFNRACSDNNVYHLSRERSIYLKKIGKHDFIHGISIKMLRSYILVHVYQSCFWWPCVAAFLTLYFQKQIDKYYTRYFLCI